MSMRQPESRSLWDLTAGAGLAPERFVADAGGRANLADLESGNTLAVPAQDFRGKSVLISSHRQLAFVLVLLQLEGIAARIVLCPPDLAPAHLPAVLAEARVDAIVCDGTGPAAQASDASRIVACHDAIRLDWQGPALRGSQGRIPTEWILFTSGTIGRPKLVVHSTGSLTGPLDDGPVAAADAIWSTFYDVRRYGGLQILLRALIGGGSMVLSNAGEEAAAFLARAGRSGVTHISGTPSHWRRALISGAAGRIAPRYVRLSGEIADQAILNGLATAYPMAEIAHAFASTEAGVAFEVRDGLAGFPAALIGQPGGKADLRIEDGSLRIRSPRTACRYLGDHGALEDAEGFVDTSDMVQLRDGRYQFIGRREGMINVGGQKVHPEEVEAFINQLPGVQMARVRAHPSPITGSLVVADIVLHPSAGERSLAAIKTDILAACRATLPAHKVPATLRVVASLDVADSGKISRRNA